MVKILVYIKVQVSPQKHSFTLIKQMKQVLIKSILDMILVAT